jgi:SP family facilitated glucose transporter-like MFS transporter 8
MTAVACTLMDNRGRRQMLVVAGFGMAVSSAFLGLYYNLSGNSADAVSTYGWLALASLIGYIMSFSLGWGPVPMLLTAEIFPARARGLAASVAVLFNWALAFLVTRYFALMNSQFGLDGSFWLFSAASFTAVAFVLRFVPETKGRSLEEIENFFSKGAFVRGI